VREKNWGGREKMIFLWAKRQRSEEAF